MSPAAARLKVGVRDAFDGAGDIKGVVSLTGRKKSWVGEWNALSLEKFPPVDAAVRIDAAVAAQGRLPPITLAMARENGCALIRLPEARGADANWHLRLSDLSSETSDIIAGICTALADGTISRAEAKKLRVEVAEGQQLLADVDAALAAIEEGK